MATEVTLTSRQRADAELGSASSRRLRRAGEVPATVYGHGGDPRSVAVDGRDLRRALQTDAGLNVLLTLDFGGGDTELVLARELQRNPVRDELVHADFLVVSRTETVSAEVPIVLLGEPFGVRESGGVLQQQLSTLSVEALVSDLPQSIEIDVTDLDLGDSIFVATATVPERVTIMSDPDNVIASIVGTSASRGALDEEGLEGVEGEEGEEGAAEGEAGEASEATED